MIGEPLVLAGCLHNLGHKKVSTSRVDSNILTPDSAVVSFTVCKDELNPEKWEEVIKAPVKATLSICGAEINLLAPPWGRVFQRLKTKVPAEEATSLQFHVRISKDDLIKVLQLSGTKGIYTTAKSEDRKVSDDYQIAWLPQMSLVDLQVTAASYSYHRGIIRSMKGGTRKSQEAYGFVGVISRRLLLNSAHRMSFPAISLRLTCSRYRQCQLELQVRMSKHGFMACRGKQSLCASWLLRFGSVQWPHSMSPPLRCGMITPS